jgi:hypothetical protein
MAGPQKRTIIEEIELAADQLVDKAKDLIEEGNVRHLRIRHEGNTILDLPITLAAISAVLAPQLAALGAIAALLTRCTIEVEREEDENKPQP